MPPFVPSSLFGRGIFTTAVHALAITILDTGCRIDELLTARTTAFDFDDLLLTVTGT
jgi:integrase